MEDVWGYPFEGEVFLNFFHLEFFSGFDGDVSCGIGLVDSIVKVYGSY